MKKILKLFIVLVLFTVCLSAENKYNFKATNGPYGGYIRSFCYDSTNHDIYANSDKIYKLNKTTNKWEKQFDTLDEYSDYFYNLIYTDSLYFISVTLGHSDVSWGELLLRSSDKGKTWGVVKDFNYDVRSIIRVGYDFIAASGHSVYKSTDLGLTWLVSNTGIDSSDIKEGRFYQLEILKSNDKNYIFLREYNNIFRSVDSGNSWQKISGNISAFDQNYGVMTVTHDNSVFVSTDSTIIKSTDFGETWIKITDGIQTNYTLNINFLKSDKDGNVYAGDYGRGLLILRKNVSTWETFNEGLIPLSPYDICFDYFANSTYCATGGGIYKSEYPVDNWQFYNDGINIPIEIECLAVNNNGDIFAGSGDNGIYFSSDKGNSWEVRNNGNTENFINKLRTDSKGNIYAGTNYSNILKSTNNGLNWAKLDLGLATPHISMVDLAISSSDYITALIAFTDPGKSDSLLISKDGGKMWEKINLPFKYCFAAVYDNYDNLFVAVDSLILKSTDNGISWEEVFKSKGYIGVYNFFVTKNNDIFFGTWRNKIYRSTDDGTTWLNLTNGFPDDCEVSCISSPDIDGRIIAGTYYDGYFVSKDNGENWEQFDAEIIDIDSQIMLEQFRSLSYDHNGTMYAATYSGVYKSDAITSVEKSRNNESFSLIYPNPAFDFITIQTSGILKTSEIYKIQFFDMLGIEAISTLSALSDTSQDGNFRIDISGLRVGVYFVKIGDKVEKFVKM